MADIFDLFKAIAKEKPAPAGNVEWLVVGLGNPGKDYDKTRHNAGFMAIDALAESLSVKIDRARFQALTADTVIGGKRVILLKPQTFMNLSGQAVAEAARFYKVPAERVLVMFDDVSLDVGKMRIRKKGSDGGHNGIKSILSQLSSDTFPRIKIGVGKKPRAEMDLADWVLSRFSADEMTTLSEINKKIPDAVKLIVSGDMEKAMNLYNA